MSVDVHITAVPYELYTVTLEKQIESYKDTKSFFNSFASTFCHCGDLPVNKSVNPGAVHSNIGNIHFSDTCPPILIFATLELSTLTIHMSI